MAVELSQEQINFTETRLSGDRTQVTHEDTEYELDQSESLTFLYNLLYDDNSILSRTDILSILNSLKIREERLPFAYDDRSFDIQGVRWPPELRTKFFYDRQRIGSKNWFYNVNGSIDKALKQTNIKSVNLNTEFFKFNKFYSKLKLHITHFQLRNLVCSNEIAKNGIFYPLSYYHDYNLHTTNDFDSNDTVHSFFRINRLMNDYDTLMRDSMKLDCIIDSRYLPTNSNSRISTLTCSDRFLASGTFEGGYILTDLYDDIDKPPDEHLLTNNFDGITNHIIINNDEELIISSNDKFVRSVDIETHATTQTRLPFAVNCLAQNPFNDRELLISGDHLHSFIIDRRCPVDPASLPSYKGQQDFSFSCDWSPSNENHLLAGNQDGCVRIWDKRVDHQPLYCWNGSLGYVTNQSGPVRNTKFSRSGEFITWAESLDHIGVLNVNDFNDNYVERIQSIEFIGKCTGLSFSSLENGYGEQLIIGVNDCPLGGILSYNFESRAKTLDCDFVF